MKKALSLVCLAVMGSVASAAPLNGTIFTEFVPNLDEGNLIGCSIAYSVLNAEGVVDKDTPNTFTGSIGIGRNPSDKNIELLITIDGAHTDGDGSAGFVTSPAPINSTYIMDDNFISNSRFRIEQRRGLQKGVISWFDLVKSAEILSNSLEKGRLRVGYKVQKTGIESFFDVDLSVLDTSANGEHYTGTKTIDEFRHCNESLSKSLIQQHS